MTTGSNKEQDQKANIPNHIGMESALGAVCLLTTKSPAHRYLFSGDYEWMIIPPIVAKQFSIFRNKRSEPIAFISFASVNEEVEKRLLSGSVKLTPRDWTSGDKLYIIDIISPFVPIPEILNQLNDGQFKDKNIKILKPNKDKKGMVGVFLKEAVLEKKDNKTESSKK
jgi:cytolysin-activating lysine-acyltransferase